jgi:hypothetical protein
MRGRAGVRCVATTAAHGTLPHSFVGRGARMPRTPPPPRTPVPPPPPPSFLAPAAARAVAGLALALHLARLALLGAQPHRGVAAHARVARHAARVAQLAQVQPARGAARSPEGGVQGLAAARRAPSGAASRRGGVRRRRGGMGGGGGHRRTCGCAAAGRGVRTSGRM